MAQVNPLEQYEVELMQASLEVQGLLALVLAKRAGWTDCLRAQGYSWDQIVDVERRVANLTMPGVSIPARKELFAWANPYPRHS